MWASGWILTKYSRIYTWDITKNELDYGNLDLISKVTIVEKLKIHVGERLFLSENTITSYI